MIKRQLRISKMRIDMCTHHNQLNLFILHYGIEIICIEHAGYPLPLCFVQMTGIDRLYLNVVPVQCKWHMITVRAFAVADISDRQHPYSPLGLFHLL
ncbi:hypothetical protein D3C81_2039500 [compost metagenome]